MHRFWRSQSRYTGAPHECFKFADFITDDRALSVPYSGAGPAHVHLDLRRLLQCAGRSAPAAAGSSAGASAAAGQAGGGAPSDEVLAAVACVYPPDGSKDDYVKNHLARWMLTECGSKYRNADQCTTLLLKLGEPLTYTCR